MAFTIPRTKRRILRDDELPPYPGASQQAPQPVPQPLPSPSYVVPERPSLADYKSALGPMLTPVREENLAKKIAERNAALQAQTQTAGSGVVSTPVTVVPPAPTVVAQPPGTQSAAVQSAQARVTPREVSPKVQELLALLESKVKSFNPDPNAVLNDPSFVAQKGVIDFQRGQAQAALRRSLASRNMLRSSPAIQSLAGSDAYYTAQEQALVPQMLAQAQARYRADIDNITGLLGQYQSADNTAFSQGLSEFNTTAPYNRLTQGQIQQGQQFTQNQAQQDAQFAQQQELARQQQVLRERQQSSAERTTEADLLGIDPITGQPTLGGRQVEAKLAENAAAAERQKELDALERRERGIRLDIEELKLKEAQTEDPTAKERAQLVLKQAQAELDKTVAEIDSIKAQTIQRQASARAEDALANQRATVEPKKPQAEVDAEKERNTRTDDLTKEYKASRDATTRWQDFVELISDAGDNINTEMEILNAVISKPGLLQSEKDWLKAMYWSGKGEAWADKELSEKFLRKPPEKDLPGGIMN